MTQRPYTKHELRILKLTPAQAQYVYKAKALVRGSNPDLHEDVVTQQAILMCRSFPKKVDDDTAA